ncbi:MAG: hypothetical protein ACPGSB_10740 [Opitutales bacterium]
MTITKMLRITQKKFIRYILLPNIIVFTALAIYFWVRSCRLR